ncbi:MAG: D-2-hydroxyacid dehydrogenase [Chloroflexi bacterium]|nr:D-2-hydroxyacid dehydrogenase [Chloroflexota bacterium]MCY4110698.1 D-2-hydroxyacid dehydrogenase [Chloroflexota bacterium]
MIDPPLQVVATFDAHGVAEALEDVPGVRLAAVGDVDAVGPHVPTADVLLVGDFDAAMLARAERLRWVHAASGGVESMLFPAFVDSPIPFSCSKGVFDTPGAEHALASMLGFARNLIYDVQHRPARDYVYGSPTELRGKTLGIAGLGRIGRELARLAQAFGMRVIALRRSDGVEHPHVDEMLHRDELPRLLRASDYVAVAVPNTPETRQLIGAAELALMKPTAYLIDVSGRDAIYDLDALADALRGGRLAGASLQIAPPPDDSPLWDIDTFHLSFHRATSSEEERRWLDLFTENIRRFQAGEPLHSLVDKHAGY